MTKERKFIKVCFLFRSSKNEAYSIEELFIGIKNFLCENKFNMSGSFSFFDAEVPEQSNSVLKILKNIVFTRSINTDIIHITGDVHYVLPFVSKKIKKVITIHDLAALQQLKKHSVKYWIIKYFWYTLPIKYADKISVISEKTKFDLLNLLNIDDSKIEIISNYVKPIFTYSHKQIDKNCFNILLIGGSTNKNTEKSILALKGINGVNLILLGSFSSNIINLLKKEKFKYKNYKNIPHIDVAKIYQNCDIVLFPSLYEGFGMPIIEAQSVGRPIITSNIPPMSDIVGDARCLINPNQVDSIRLGVLKVLEDNKYRESIIEHGLVNVKKYNIQTVTEKYYSLYLKIIGSDNS